MEQEQALGVVDGERSVVRGRVAFAGAIFLGAFLLFQVQPLIGKYILPWFGGSPAVWTTAMLFFQVMLLGGYGYAHLLGKLRPRAQAVVHLAVLAGALAMLPIVPGEGWKPGVEDDPAVRIMALLGVTVGAPYFALSATGPLMQKWFSQVNPGVSPYRLYALSNVGSLLALVSYPFVFEPAMTRRSQAMLWSVGLGVFALICGYCAVMFSRRFAASGRGIAVAEGADVEPVKPQRLDILLWIALPACASVLLLAVTNQISNNVAVVPFLWVLELAIYLLTFILCFDHPRWYQRMVYLPLLGITLAGCVWLLSPRLTQALWIEVAAFTTVLFICCMVCHGETVRLKPHPRYLTSFYLAIAAGGAMGGIFVGLLAPRLFDDYVELPGVLIAIALLAFYIVVSNEEFLPRWSRDAKLMVAGLASVVVGVVVWKVMDVRHTEAYRWFATIAKSRSFYGVLSVMEFRPEDYPASHHRRLRHGGINHGMQYLHPNRRELPTSYYVPKAGVGYAMTLLRPDKPRKFGMVGLGVGTLSTYGEPGDVMRYYEIDPDVKRMAERYFTYLSDCSAKLEFVLGDARLSMEREEAQNYDVLVLDAFSGDAIPMHLLTREAMEIYLRHLKADGVIAVHVTNRYLYLRPVVEALAADRGMRAAPIYFRPRSAQESTNSSEWVLVTRNEEFIRLIPEGVYEKNESGRRVPLWTDERVSLLGVVKQRGRAAGPAGTADPEGDPSN